MNSGKNVLLTGHNGYIGSVMAPQLQLAGFQVTGLDTGYFADCTLVPDHGDSFPVIRKDLRDLELSDLRDFDAVIHLAALSNDPIGNLNERWTEEINYESSMRLAELARAAGVRRFLFSSSCIMYGMSSTILVNEDSPTDPKTEYARSKVRAEQAISGLAADGFSPTFLRNGTVYGLSPRMRFDTVFNSLVASAVVTGTVLVRSDGKPWRPVVHVQDVARAFIEVLQAPESVIHNQAFNTGADHLNHQVIALAEAVARVIPGVRLQVLSAADADQRTYRTDFGKFARAFPSFEFNWTPEGGARELSAAFQRIGLDQATWTDKRFTRLKWLNYLLETGSLDQDLRWAAPTGEAAGQAGSLARSATNAALS